eukprot:1160494-Pelagomonas_calceolata.AAC.18
MKISVAVHAAAKDDDKACGCARHAACGLQKVMVGREKAPEAGAGRNDSRAKEGNKPPPPEFWQSVCVRGEGGGELRAPLHASCAKSKGCEVHSAWHAFCESFRLV